MLLILVALFLEPTWLRFLWKSCDGGVPHQLLSRLCVIA